MSRIGKKMISIPAKVEITIGDHSLSVKGPKGLLQLALHPVVRMKQHDGNLLVSVADASDVKQRAIWGLFRSLAQNMIHGVTEGYEAKLEVNGVGYRVAQTGKKLVFEVGFSHPVEFVVPESVEVKVDKNSIILTGIDKQLVFETAARIRKIKPPEPYKGKGIKYLDEVIQRKAGKAVKGASAG